jgi:hypothetical protein
MGEHMRCVGEADNGLGGTGDIPWVDAPSESLVLRYMDERIDEKWCIDLALEATSALFLSPERSCSVP